MDKSKWKYNISKHRVEEQPTMEEPVFDGKHGYAGWELGEFQMAEASYNSYIKKLRSLPVSGKVSWADGEDVTGKFREQYQQKLLSGKDKWEDCPSYVYSTLHVAYRRIVAIPIIQEQPHDKKLLKTLLDVNALIKEEPQQDDFPFFKTESGKWFYCYTDLNGLNQHSAIFESKSEAITAKNKSQYQPSLLPLIEDEKNLWHHFREVVFAANRMRDNYSEGDDAVKRRLWKNLHTAADAARDFYEDNKSKTAPLIDKGQEEDELANKYLVKLMEDKPVKLIQYMLVQIGRQMVEAHAETMELKQESDIGKNRYRIECKAKIIKVKNKNS